MTTHAAAAPPDAIAPGSPAANGVAEPGTDGEPPLTKRRRVQLANQERRRQEKARKREPPPLPAPPAGPVDKV